jgi:hypothetical protein
LSGITKQEHGYLQADPVHVRGQRLSVTGFLPTGAANVRYSQGTYQQWPADWLLFFLIPAPLSCTPSCRAKNLRPEQYMYFQTYQSSTASAIVQVMYAQVSFKQMPAVVLRNYKFVAVLPTFDLRYSVIEVDMVSQLEFSVCCNSFKEVGHST